MGHPSKKNGTIVIRAFAAVFAAAIACSSAFAQGEWRQDYSDCLLFTDPEQGVSACKRALQSPALSTAERAGVFSALGAHQRRAGNIDGALSSLDQSLALLPTNPATQTELGNALFVAGNMNDAKAAYDRALARNRTLVRALNNRALTFAKLGNMDAALQDFELALSLSPDDGTIWNNRANVNCGLGRADVATKDRLQALYNGRFTASSAQSGLRRAGYYGGPADGIWGPDSDDALLAWSKAGCPNPPKNRLK